MKYLLYWIFYRLWLKNKGFDVPKTKLADTAPGKAIIKKKCTPEQANRYDS